LTARIILAGLLVLLLAGLAIKPPKAAATPKGQGDVGLFTTVVDQMRGGKSYYDAMGDELRTRGYPTRSVFNWRMPIVFCAVAAKPRPTRIAFVALGVLVIVATLALLLKDSPEVLLVSVLAQIGVVIPLIRVPEYALMTEAWAGFLIALSLAAYGRRLHVAGASLGTVALFARELAAPYCVICGLLAIAERRWRETAVWAAGAAAFGAYFLVHVAEVTAHIGANDLTHKQSWVQFGGLPFVLRTITFTGWFDALPVWTRAFGCVLLVAALWARGARRQLQAAVVTFLIFFAVVGQSFNQYWGLVTGSAWALAYGYGVAGLSRLITAAKPGEPSPPLQSSTTSRRH
jgi:hypothetical protein